jgi:hypothetical protein
MHAAVAALARKHALPPSVAADVDALLAELTGAASPSAPTLVEGYASVALREPGPVEPTLPLEHSVFRAPPSAATGRPTPHPASPTATRTWAPSAAAAWAKSGACATPGSTGPWR